MVCVEIFLSGTAIIFPKGLEIVKFFVLEIFIIEAWVKFAI